MKKATIFKHLVFLLTALNVNILFANDLEKMTQVLSDELDAIENQISMVMNGRTLVIRELTKDPLDVQEITSLREAIIGIYARAKFRIALLKSIPDSKWPTKELHSRLQKADAEINKIENLYQLISGIEELSRFGGKGVKMVIGTNFINTRVHNVEQLAQQIEPNKSLTGLTNWLSKFKEDPEESSSSSSKNS